jgi:uncharacterized protein YjiS (DUF1127 family)
VSEQTTTISTRNPAIARLAPRRDNALAALAAKLSTGISTWIARSGERQTLREFAETNDQHMLEDIGVTREQARHTAARWFWQT